MEADVGCSDQDRFEIELEFVQCLANPFYLNWLAQNKQFEDPAFVAYLKHLQYWKQPEYAKFIIYPHCLTFLDMLQSKEFREAVANMQIAELVHRQQHYFWQHYWANRMKEAAAAKAEGGTTGAMDAEGGRRQICK